MEEVDQRVGMLPEGFNYNFVPSEKEDIFIFYIKEVCDKESAEEWFDLYEKMSYWTWRVSETFPHSGRRNLYKKKFRCHHNVCYPKVANPKRIVTSKHTGCPAALTITVKRYMPKSRSKRPDYEINRDWPCVVELFRNHNHEMKSPSVLKYRPMSTETKQKLLELFKKGHSVSSAMSTIKFELFLEKNEEYSTYAADGKFVPTVSQAQYLYNKEFLDLQGSKSSDLEENGYICSENIDSEQSPSTALGDGAEVKHQLLPGALETLKEIRDRITRGISNEPDVFIPAINTMLQNYKSFVTSDDALISAMYLFGTGSEATTNASEQRGPEIQAQPTSAGKRKCGQIFKGRPSKKCSLAAGGVQEDSEGGLINKTRTVTNHDHDYSSFGKLPNKKRKVAHSLQEAVDDNKHLPFKL